uniref:NAC domain-containing protein n=1 Tax=Kalanchoe fedtschenkoi TaxID=63787 RepID=A0A7N0TFB3_KALFE
MASAIRTNWVMHEYRLIHTSSSPSSSSCSLNALKDSFALCRVFKKTSLIVPQSKFEKREDTQNGPNRRRNKIQLQYEESNAINEAAEDYEESFHPYDNCNNNPSAASSISDATQERSLVDEKEDMEQANACPFFAASISDEANSSAPSYLYSPKLDSSDLLFQDLQSFHNNILAPFDPYAYSPALSLEDFTPLNENNRYREADHSARTIATFEEIISLCSSQHHSIPLHIPY